MGDDLRNLTPEERAALVGDRLAQASDELRAAAFKAQLMAVRVFLPKATETPSPHEKR